MKGKNNIVINPKTTITIFNILRDIGLNTRHRGTKYINKAVQLLITSNNDIFVLKDIYNSIANIYDNTSPKQIKNDISYSLKSRNEKKSKYNFEKIFGFEYNDYYFTNKNIIEEIYCIIIYN
jgi:hypothetical protein